VVVPSILTEVDVETDLEVVSSRMVMVVVKGMSSGLREEKEPLGSEEESRRLSPLCSSHS